MHIKPYCQACCSINASFQPTTSFLLLLLWALAGDLSVKR
jgi:hypothetical protein